MQQVLTVLGWVLAPVCAVLVTKLVEQSKELKAEKENRKKRDEAMVQGMKTLLRQKTIDYHRTYVEAGLAVPVSIKEQATATHEAYRALGGNGTGTKLYEDIMKAPTE